MKLIKTETSYSDQICDNYEAFVCQTYSKPLLDSLAITYLYIKFTYNPSGNTNVYLVFDTEHQLYTGDEINCDYIFLDFMTDKLRDNQEISRMKIIKTYLTLEELDKDFNLQATLNL